MWTIDAHLRFHPGGQMCCGSVVRPYEVLIPADATRVEIWFRNWFKVMSFCEDWDSRYGQNYWYDVERN